MDSYDNESVVESRKTPEITSNKVGRAIGYLFAYTVIGCTTAISVALTIKFIMWLF